MSVFDFVVLDKDEFECRACGLRGRGHYDPASEDTYLPPNWSKLEVSVGPYHYEISLCPDHSDITRAERGPAVVALFDTLAEHLRRRPKQEPGQ